MDIRQGTQTVVVLGPCCDKTDGVTAETALATPMDDGTTTGVKIKKHGGALAFRAATVVATAHDDVGFYNVTLKAADVDTVGSLLVQYEDAATLVPVFRHCRVLTPEAWDLLYAPDGPIPTLGIVDRGQLQSFTSTTSTIRAAATFGTNATRGMVLTAWTEGSNNFQSVIITSNAGDVLAHPAFTIALSGTVRYTIMGTPASNSDVPSDVALSGAQRVAVAQECLKALSLVMGNKLEIVGTDLVLYDTDGTTVLGSAPFTRLGAPANPMLSVGG